MSIEDYAELAQEFAEFGYRETSDPTDPDRRIYKVEKWDAAELHVEALIHASNDLECARAIFASEKNRRPRGRYTLRQGLRVLERWPPRQSEVTLPPLVEQMDILRRGISATTTLRSCTPCFG